MKNLVNKILNKVQSFKKSRFDLDDIDMSDDDAATQQLFSYRAKDKEDLRKRIQSEIKTYMSDPMSYNEIIDLNFIDVSLIENFDDLFRNIEDEAYIQTYKFNYMNVDVSEWDVHNAKSMESMFKGMRNFNCDLSKWHVDNVTNMSYMFDGCFNFSGDISNWHVDNVTDMSRMFSFAFHFNQNLNNWNIAKVEKFNYMFYDAISFNKPLDKWANIFKNKIFPSNILKDNLFGDMFSSAISFQQDLSSWHITFTHHTRSNKLNVDDPITVIDDPITVKNIFALKVSKNHIKNFIDDTCLCFFKSDDYNVQFVKNVIAQAAPQGTYSYPDEYLPTVSYLRK